MIEQSATIQNEQGIHCRPSALILNAIQGFEGDISIQADDQLVPLKSVLDLMSLGLEQGRTITIRVDGGDEESMCQRLVELFETNFDFPPR
jgi:phosphocarrier protein